MPQGKQGQPRPHRHVSIAAGLIGSLLLFSASAGGATPERDPKQPTARQGSAVKPSPAARPVANSAASGQRATNTSPARPASASPPLGVVAQAPVERTLEQNPPSLPPAAASSPAAPTTEVVFATASQLGALARVSNVFVDTDLREVLQDIATQAGMVIVPDPTVVGVVTAELKEVTVDKALEIVLAGTGYGVQRERDYYLIYSVDPKGAAFLSLSQTRIVRLEYAEAVAAQKLLSPGLQTYVQADEKSRTVAVTAPPALLARILSDLQQIDKAPQHVMLDVRVVVMEQTALSNLGINWDFPRVSAGAFVNNTTSGVPFGVRVGYTPAQEFTGALNLTLNLLEENSEASVVASPQVMAQDGRLAEVAVKNEEYFQIVTDGVFTQAQLQQIDSGTVLKITPRIGQNRDVTLEMAVEVSDVVARGENDLPVVTRRTAQNTVRIKSGGTAVVAGLMDSRSDAVRRNVPGANKLPLIGGAFRNRVDRTRSNQIAVFVTASLVEQEDAGRVQQPSRRTPLPSVDPISFRLALRQSVNRLK